VGQNLSSPSLHHPTQSNIHLPALISIWGLLWSAILNYSTLFTVTLGEEYCLVRHFFMSSGRNLRTFRKKLSPLFSGYWTPLLHTTLLNVHAKYRYISVIVRGTTSQKPIFARIEVLIIRRNTVSRGWGWKMTVSVVTKLRKMTF
jgi:hypothetical protein